MPGHSTEAFVTLATNDPYGLGCLVLGSSLRRTRTDRQLVVMITDGVSRAMRDQLSQTFDLVHKVTLLDSQDPFNLQLLGRPDLNVTFTKLHCWRLTQFTKAVFLDADTLVLRNIDELFEREELSAAPDAGWPDCFNSGVFVFRPSLDTYNDLVQFSLTSGSFDGGDQGLLNSYFSDWAKKDINKHLPFIYNVVSQAFYSYLPAFTKFRSSIRVVHFIGAVKPWHTMYNMATGELTAHGESRHDFDFLKLWWAMFLEEVYPKLNAELSEIVKNVSDLKFAAGDFLRAELYKPRSDIEWKSAWEHGNIDYLGEDSFENIMKKLNETLVIGSPENIVAASVAPFPIVPPALPKKSSSLPVVGPLPGTRSSSSQKSHLLSFDFQHPDFRSAKNVVAEDSADKHSTGSGSPISHPDFMSDVGAGEGSVSRIRMGVAAADVWKPDKRIRVAGKNTISPLSALRPTQGPRHPSAPSPASRQDSDKKESHRK